MAIDEPEPKEREHWRWLNDEINKTMRQLNVDSMLATELFVAGDDKELEELRADLENALDQLDEITEGSGKSTVADVRGKRK